MKILLPVLWVILLGGCATSGTYAPEGAPDVNRFPAEGLDYEVSDSVNDNRMRAIQFLSKKRVRYRQEIIEPYTYVLTVFVPEPRSGSDRRVRRTAFKLALTENKQKPSCTNSSLTWIVESRGIREETWRVLKSDNEYTPSALEEITSLFTENNCNE